MMMMIPPAAPSSTPLTGFPLPTMANGVASSTSVDGMRPMSPIPSASLQPSAVHCHSTWEETVLAYVTDVPRGLPNPVAATRLAQYGVNELHVGDSDPWHVKLLEQFQNPLIYLLLGSAVVSAAVGEWDNAVSISLAIAIVATVAFVQEYKSEQSLEALNTLVPHYANVRRDGHPQRLFASQLVPGDICILSTGDRVPADIRLIEAVDLAVDESTLTGETKPVRKATNVLARSHQELSLSERKNVCFMGTLVKEGHGLGVVIGTGKNTEFGAVFLLMREVEVKKTPLQQNMDQLGKHLSIVSSVVILIILVIGWLFQGRPLLEMFTISVSLAVAAIPEGLPVVVTVTLALGVLRLAERKAIIKKLPSIETLSCVNVLCCDKTGTLTTNQMTVQHVYTPLLAHPVDVVGDPPAGLLDDPTFQELLVCANVGFRARRPARPLGPKVTEVPFSKEDPSFMVTEWSLPGRAGTTHFAKGALDRVLAHCATVAGGNPVTDAVRKDLHRHADQLAAQGLRVLALAAGTNPRMLTLLGLVSIHDPPRNGVSDAVLRLQRAGVRVIMMTGDAKATAVAIARQVGIETDCAAPGTAVDAPEEAASLDRVSVFYRMSPAQKLGVVKRLQRMGYVVALVGDGVNDAPALRLADIGVSMGVSGTDVSKEAADMILVNDELSTIVAAIEEGKSIFMNIRNFLSFQLSTSVSALSLVALATFAGLPNPLNAMQILWINIIMDGPPAQSLGVEPVDRDAVTNTPPRSSVAPMITRDLIVKIVLSSLIIVAGTLFVYTTQIASDATPEKVTTMTFTIFVLYDTANALTCRSLYKSIFHVGFTTNRMFNYATAFSLLGHLCVVYVQPFQAIFQTVALSLSDWAYIIAMASVVFWADEVRKFGPGQLWSTVVAQWTGAGGRRTARYDPLEEV
ncbi:calcium-transporting P-type ATPase, PMR1-type [Allomyces macrogynus ATCC 38327]|uniref:Calcium-transporting ATPase n=1 Tax=Allomyces macrogynus (strain ATCC 38327) TaxID=578462 RepID=A0A0L0SUW7_ALLM3|nr:calcium-transporting P-type ATPase, PMR1-type [Allomyces macrogynus ATCC 38327]|eukprot:KNE66124.1 calcium-transporting P-type ATPase, PMR1-type [Allomyces macrogynus ATCC 38327]